MDFWRSAGRCVCKTCCSNALMPTTSWQKPRKHPDLGPRRWKRVDLSIIYGDIGDILMGLNQKYGGFIQKYQTYGDVDGCGDFSTGYCGHGAYLYFTSVFSWGSGCGGCLLVVSLHSGKPSPNGSIGFALPQHPCHRAPRIFWVN